MFGTIVNTSAILIGTVVGTMLNRGVEERYKEITMQGMGMVAVAIGIANISEGMKLIINPVIFILAILGDNTLLYANSVLDGVTSVILSINYGLSIGIVAIVLFFWQGSIYLGAIASQEVLSQLTLLGGIFVLATGINILGIIKIKTLNLLPALFIPFIAKSLGLI